jgi:hypothetical protein
VAIFWGACCVHGGGSSDACARVGSCGSKLTQETLLICDWLQVPVGRGTLGRIMNVIGEPVDECGPIGKHACCHWGCTCTYQQLYQWAKATAGQERKKAAANSAQG